MLVPLRTASTLLAHLFIPQHSAQVLPPQGSPPQPPSLKFPGGTTYPNRGGRYTVAL